MSFYNKEITINSFKIGDIVTITQEEKGEEVKYTGTVDALFKAPINSGEVRLVGDNLKFGFKDIAVIWIKNFEIIKSEVIEECPCMKEPSYGCGMKCSRCGREL